MRARTTILAAVVAGLSLVVASVALLVTLRHSLTRNGDDLARSRARDVAALAADDRLPRHLVDVGEDSVGQVVDRNGHVLAWSSGVAGSGPISDSVPAGDQPVVFSLHDAPDDDETEDYRVWALAAETPDGPVTIYIGTSLESVDEAVGTVQRLLLVGLPVILALLATGTWLVVGRTLRPVEDIRRRVAGISASALDQRVPVPATNDEISRLAMTMNAMLDRLEAADRRQRTFVADASHELQTPLAALRTQLEVALTHPEHADWGSTARDLLSDGARMERLVRDLLFLAREDSSPTPPPSQPVDLDDVVLDEVARLSSTDGTRVDTSSVSAAPVRGSRDELGRLVRNLLENAVDHATTTVRLEVGTSDGSSRLVVTDDGPGIAPTDRDRVFDRFYRADTARAEGHGHSGTGLGLSIARAIAGRHGGSLVLEDSPVGARFVVRLPAL